MSAKQSAKSSTSKPDKWVSKIEASYWEHLLEAGKPPSSIYRFCKDLGIAEKDFYDRFSHFDAIESGYWESGIIECHTALEADKDAADYSAAQWLSAFYYTYFEYAVENRSKFLLRFPRLKEGKSQRLRGWHRAFDKVAETYIHKAKDEGLFLDNDRLQKAQKRAVVLQARSLMDFHLNDTSPKFEDTDALIEKSVRFIAESLRLPVIDSAIDLARFLFPRISK